jgi:hypothetical protein
MRFAVPRLIDCVMFLLLLSGPPRLRTRDATASLRADIDTVVLLQLFVWGSGLVWLFIRLYPAVVTNGVVPKLKEPQLIGGMLLLVLSLGVALAPGPMLTGYSVYQLGIMLAFSWIFVQLYGPDVYVRYLFMGYLLLATAILLAWIYMPEMVVRRARLRGDLIAPAGAISALGLMLCLSGAVRLKKGFLVLAAGIFSVVLFASQTRTAYAAFAASLVLGWLFRHSAPVKKVFPIATVVLLVAAMNDLLPVAREYVTRRAEEVGTLSERTPLWEHLVGAMLRDSPVIGLGYYSASRVLGPQYNRGLGDAHSAFVEVLVGGGLVGGLLFLALYAAVFVYAAKLFTHARDDPMTFAVIGLLVMVFVLSLTSTSGIHAGPLGFTFWSATALLPAVWEQVRTSRSLHP